MYFSRAKITVCRWGIHPPEALIHPPLDPPMPPLKTVDYLFTLTFRDFLEIRKAVYYVHIAKLHPQSFDAVFSLLSEGWGVSPDDARDARG